MKISIKSLDFIYFDSKSNIVELFNSLSESIEAPNVISILGPSGCGKSTFLKLIMGLIKPDSGIIKIDGLSPCQHTKLGNFSACFQHPTLLPWRNVAKNIILPLELRGEKINLTSLDWLLHEFGLDDLREFYPHQLSGGQSQRVSLARSLAVPCKYLFLDEPFSQLDEILRHQLLLFIKEYCHKHEIKIIIITHDVSESVLISDKIIIMHSHPVSAFNYVDIKYDDIRTMDFTKKNKFHVLVERIRKYLISGASGIC